MALRNSLKQRSTRTCWQTSQQRRSVGASYAGVRRGKTSERKNKTKRMEINVETRAHRGEKETRRESSPR